MNSHTTTSKFIHWPLLFVNIYLLAFVTGVWADYPQFLTLGNLLRGIPWIFFLVYYLKDRKAKK